MYDFARQVEQGTFADQAGVNRVLALPMFGTAYRMAQALGYSGRAFGFMIFINRMLAVGCVILFWKLLSYRRRADCPGIEANAPPDRKPSASSFQLPTVLCLGFSYGFWRYANEAETYILAAFLVLLSWQLALRGRVWWCAGVSALGVLVHLLNLVPLLLIIPLYYLLSSDWKKAVLHGVAAGLLVAVGYAVCFRQLDFSELGAQHHALEAGLNSANLLRALVALGQCLVSGNFLFGFGRVRELLVELFPSRVLDEEFFMAAHMGGWIPVCGIVTLIAVAAAAGWVLVAGFRGRCGNKPKADPLWWSALVWLCVYIAAVVRTESGSPELWILALVPFWLLVSPLLKGRAAWLLVALFFSHNLVAGLLPVISKKSDYHVQKADWVVQHAGPDDLVLSSYEPILIFYLHYFSTAEVINSGESTGKSLDERLGKRKGNVYAFDNFFQPLESMRVRSPGMYGRMRSIGERFEKDFVLIETNHFGGVYRYQPPGKTEISNE